MFKTMYFLQTYVHMMLMNHLFTLSFWFNAIGVSVMWHIAVLSAGAGAT